MPVPLLKTKLFIPALSSDHIERPRLIERLEQGLRAGQRLTLLSAPAGYGKTTLLSSWISACRLPAAWLSLEEQDNDPARFLAYLLASLQSVEALAAEQAPKAGPFTLPSPQLARRVEGYTLLINQISGLPHKVIVILDDYHCITAPIIHTNLAFLIDHLPENAHLVIATRVDPPLPIPRLRGRGHLSEIRQADLSLDPDETVAFLRQAIEQKLSQEDVALLAARTEGWIAGLKMAALALQSQLTAQKTAHISDLIRLFGGSSRYILDYLTEEVLRQQPESVQTFLLCTSILKQMSSALCDALLEPLDAGLDPAGAASIRSFGGSQEVLEYLEHANLFLVGLDDERRWYRYHHLFTDLLYQRLLRLHPAWVQALHQQASQWYAQQNELDGAIEHALAAHQYEDAADWIEQGGEAWLKRGEVFTILKRIQSLPEDLVHHRPTLCIYNTLASVFGGRAAKDIQAHLQAAEASDNQGQHLGETTLLHAVQAVLAGDGQSTLDLAQRALDHLPEQRHFLRDLARRTLATGYFLAGKLETASQLYEENARISQSVGDRLGAAADYYRLAATYAVRGQLRQAERLYQRALDLATTSQGRRMMVAMKILAGLGDLAREQDDLQAAEVYLQEAIYLAKDFSGAYAIAAHIYLAQVWQARGGLDRALQTIQVAEQLAQNYDPTEIDDVMVQAYQARLWIARGDLAAAARWAQQRGLEGQPPAHGQRQAAAISAPTAPGGLYIHMIEQLTLARLYLARQQHQPVLAQLQALVHLAEENELRSYLIEALALQALAYQANGETPRALQTLRQALDLAEPEGYVRLFANEGEPMHRLLQQAAADQGAGAYLSRLLVAIAPPPVPEQPASSPAPAGQTLMEPLSERELEVLRLLRSELTSGEIATQLYLSTHTVRSHLKNIYGKLGVHSRYEAIVRAQELGLL